MKIFAILFILSCTIIAICLHRHSSAVMTFAIIAGSLCIATLFHDAALAYISAKYPKRGKSKESIKQAVIFELKTNEKAITKFSTQRLVLELAYEYKTSKTIIMNILLELLEEKKIIQKNNKFISANQNTKTMEED